MKKLVLLLLILLLLLSCKVEDLGIQSGFADLGDIHIDRVYRLDGEWDFKEEGDWNSGQVPSLWGGKIQKGAYRLTLSLPSEESRYAIYIRDCFTKYRLSVNGIVLHDGKTPSIKPRLFTFSAAERATILFEIEDTETTFGGIHSSVFFGNPEEVFQLFTRRIMGDFLIAGALLFAALFYMSIGLVDRKGVGREYLWLAAANALMALRFVTTYNRVILLLIDNFYILERVSTVTTPLITIAYSLFFLRFFRYPGYTLVMRYIIGISLFYSLMIISAPIMVFYRVSPLYLVVIMLVIYATVHIGIIHYKRAEPRKIIFVWLIVLGILLYLLIRAFLIWKGEVAEQHHLLYGFLMILQGVMNAGRYGETFKHNVSLIEQKDNLFSRVSHSLKTPLYSVKGALDLVRNSGEKEKEFEKQFKTMDLAVTDLLIQINELLNLTEFEFSYQMVQTRVPVTVSVQTVLIVDDQSMISSILGQQLKTFVKRLNLLSASSAEEALFVLKTNNVDFIFSDIMMNKMNGYQFVSRCRSLGYTVPIYLFSAGSDPLCKEKSIEVGANGYLEKPATIEQLKKVTSLQLLHIGP